MKGRIWKEGEFWIAEVPELDVMAQGRTEKEAHIVIGEAIESLINQADVSVRAVTMGGGKVQITCSKPGVLEELKKKRRS